MGGVRPGRPVRERGLRASAGTSVPRPDLLDHRGGGSLAVASVGPRPELDPGALKGRTHRQVGEGITTHHAEREPTPGLCGQVGALVHGQLAEAGQEACEPEVQIGE